MCWRLAALMLLISSQTACGEGHDIYVPSTWNDPDEQIVLVVTDAAGAPVSAVDPLVLPRGVTQLSWDVEVDGEFRIAALRFDGVHAAGIERCGAAYGTTHRPLPPPEEAVLTEVLSIQSKRATFLSDGTLDLSDLRYASCSPSLCDELSSEVAFPRTDGPWTVGGLLAYDETTVLGILSSTHRSDADQRPAGVLQKIASDGAQMEVLSSSVGFSSIESDGTRIYVVEGSSTLLELDPETLAVVHTSSSSGGRLVRGSDGRVVAFGPRAVEIIGPQGEREPSSIGPLPLLNSVAFSDAGRLAAMADRVLYLWAGNSWMATEVAAGERLESITFLGEQLLVLAEKRVFLETEEGFEALGTNFPAYANLRAARQIRDGFLITGTGGFVGGLFEGELCDFSVGNHSMGRPTVLSDHLAAAGNVSSNAGQVPVVAWLRREL